MSGQVKSVENQAIYKALYLKRGVVWNNRSSLVCETSGGVPSVELHKEFIVEHRARRI